MMGVMGWVSTGDGNGSGGDTSTLTFTTNGSGAATVAALIGKTPGTDLHLYEYSPDGAGTLYGTNLYSFDSGTGTFGTTIPLTPNTKYLVFYE